MPRIHANNFETTLNGAITNSALSMTLTSVTGFPAVGAGVTCNVTLEDGSNTEIVKCTAISGFVITIVRAQEGTSGLAFGSGSIVSLRATRDSIDSKQDTLSGASLTSATLASGDLLLFQDVSDSSNLKTCSPSSAANFLLDSNSNLSANNFLAGYATTAAAAGTTTLTVTSAQQQFFTGTTTQTIVLPVASTLVLGFKFTIVNNSTGTLTIQSSGANTITTLSAGNSGIFTCILTSGTSAASWSAILITTAGGGNVTGPISSTDKGIAIYNGTLGTTIQNSTITIPAANTLSGITTLKDSAGNQYMGVVATASSVNYLTITNAATASNPILSVDGSDTNRSLVLNGKGTGYVQIGSAGKVKLSVGTSTNAIEIYRGTQNDGTSTAVGYLALAATNNSAAVNNTAIGWESGGALTNGPDNTFTGYSSGILIVTGSQNCYFGSNSGAIGSSNNDGCAFGYLTVGGGGRNSVFGSQAGHSGATGGVSMTTTATDNTLLGYLATVDTNSAVGCIALGSNAVAAKSTGTTSSDNGPGIAIGSASKPVGFRGDATIYSAVGASAGYWRVKINGTIYKIQLFADV